MTETRKRITIHSSNPTSASTTTKEKKMKEFQGKVLTNKHLFSSYKCVAFFLNDPELMNGKIHIGEMSIPIAELKPVRHSSDSAIRPPSHHQIICFNYRSTKDASEYNVLCLMKLLTLQLKVRSTSLWRSRC